MLKWIKKKQQQKTPRKHHNIHLFFKRVVTMTLIKILFMKIAACNKKEWQCFIIFEELSNVWFSRQLDFHIWICHQAVVILHIVQALESSSQHPWGEKVLFPLNHFNFLDALKETQEPTGWTLGAIVQVLTSGMRKSRLHTRKELSRGQKKTESRGTRGTERTRRWCQY